MTRNEKIERKISKLKVMEELLTHLEREIEFWESYKKEFPDDSTTSPETRYRLEAYQEIIKILDKEV